MKTTLPNNKKTTDYLEKLTPIYIVGRWAHWGVLGFWFSGKFSEIRDPYSGKMEYHPMVWMYNDHNGIADQYELVDIFHTTSGSIHSWTFSKESADVMADFLERRDNERYGYYN